MATEKPVVEAWVDGACTYNPGPAGIGIVLICGRHRKEISGCLGRGTNNVAELAAAIVALRAIRDPERRVRLLTDSAYVHGLITLGWKPKANRALVRTLRAEAARFPHLEVVHVPGHAGVPENERADALAREAIARGEPPISVPELVAKATAAGAPG
jgi:ribonuclease HI